MYFGNRSVPLLFNIHLARVTWLCGWLVVHKRKSVFPKDMDNQPEKYSTNAHQSIPDTSCCQIPQVLRSRDFGRPTVLAQARHHIQVRDHHTKKPRLD